MRIIAIIYTYKKKKRTYFNTNQLTSKPASATFRYQHNMSLAGTPKARHTTTSKDVLYRHRLMNYFF